ncbi:DMT family transporter [Streptomyces sp. NPDC048248]|uniref:EamA family transporter n=1 Tax=Streptomyces sp. NPDC048248 TaxID=3365523 RepID=UPI003712F971
MALMLGSGMSNQIGASVAAFAFPVLGPVGVVAVRQWVAAAVLLGAGRPKLRAFTAAQWRPVLGLAVVFATMNLTLYTAIDRIGLGLAVTLEFLGPLTVALVSSRRRVDLLCAVAAAVAVVVLVRPRPSTDYLGIGLGLTAAVCWGCYILLNRTVGARLPGLEGSAAAAAVSGLLYLPVGAVVLWLHRPTSGALLCALAAGVLSSAVPFLADLLALRRVPAHFFGTFMSVNPVFAALAGMLVLGQRLDLASWLAIAAIVTANTVAVGFAARHPKEATAGRAGQERAAQTADLTLPDPVSDPGAGPLRTEAAERPTRHPADCLT